MWLQTLAAELPITLADPSVWLSIGQGLLIGAVCLLFGVWVARFVGLLPPDAPAGETLGVGLASGLLVLVAWWAAIASSGRSAFTPVAIGFAIAIGLAVARRWRARGADGTDGTGPQGESETVAPAADGSTALAVPASARRRSLVPGVVGGVAFVVVVAVLYGSTMTLSPRDGVQPLEFTDEAYYSVLGADLAKHGEETILSPSGIARIDGLPVLTWYHWGEVWLAAAVITITGATPLDARHFVVLPLMLLAAAALTGSIVRRMTKSASRGAFLFGFLACLFLAPVPMVAGPYFGSWAVGLLFGITSYGLAAVAALFALYGLAVLGSRSAAWTLACFAGTAAALLLPAHVVIALLALVGVGSVWTIRIGQSLWATRGLPVVTPIWRETFVATGVALAATVAWGLLTGHGVGASGLSPSVTPFNTAWRETIAIVTLGSGAFLAIAIAWFMVRKERTIEADLYVGTCVLLVTGAFVWGARLGDYNMFHVFFAGIAVFATPVAAVAVWSIWLRLRATGYARLAFVMLVLVGAQLELGAANVVVRLASFGPGTYPPVSTSILAEIRNLPPDAKLAYACSPREELAFWDPGLVSLDAHTGRRVVPMCFQAEWLTRLTGTPMSPDVPNPLFRWAPQRALYPDADAQPPVASVVAFLEANGIEYIYADSMHPNTLVPDAVAIATDGDTQVLRLP